MSRAHQIQNHQLNQQWRTVLGYKETLKVKTVGPQSSMHYFILGLQPRDKPGGGVGGGGTPYDGLYGKAPPGRGIFFRLQVYERVRDFTCRSI